MGGQRRRIRVEGYAEQPGEDMEHHFAEVGPDYFEVLRIPLVRGRGVTMDDREGAPGTIVVNEAFARKFWPGEDPLGKRVSASGPDGNYLEVVGVAKDSKYYTLAEDPPPFFYLSALQSYNSLPIYMIRTVGDPAALIGAVREQARALDGKLLIEAQSLVDATSFSLLPARAAASILIGTGLVALLLAAIGIYGVISYSFQQRTHEIGVRMALGAERHDVLRLVFAHGIRLAVMGCGIGLVVALATTRLVTSFLYGVSPTDPLSFGATIVILFLVALLASYIPAQRAARLDPTAALREQ
jgi:predicted permease